MKIKLWNAKELMKEVKKTIKADLSEREGLPSNHFKFGNFRGLRREISKPNLQIETPFRVPPGEEALRDEIMVKRDSIANFLCSLSERKVEKEAYTRLKRIIEGIEYNEEGNEITKRVKALEREITEKEYDEKSGSLRKRIITKERIEF